MLLERHRQPLLPRHRFFFRFLRFAAAAVALVLSALALGICGYHFIEGVPWIDALVDAAMILSGMGPIQPLHTTGGKFFAAAYALLSGFVFLSVAALLFTPLLHRMLHHFHLDERSPPKRP